MPNLKKRIGAAKLATESQTASDKNKQAEENEKDTKRTNTQRNVYKHIECFYQQHYTAFKFLFCLTSTKENSGLHRILYNTGRESHVTWGRGSLAMDAVYSLGFCMTINM